MTGINSLGGNPYAYGNNVDYNEVAKQLGLTGQQGIQGAQGLYATQPQQGIQSPAFSGQPQYDVYEGGKAGTGVGLVPMTLAVAAVGGGVIYGLKKGKFKQAWGGIKKFFGNLGKEGAKAGKSGNNISKEASEAGNAYKNLRKTIDTSTMTRENAYEILGGSKDALANLTDKDLIRKATNKVCKDIAQGDNAKNIATYVNGLEKKGVKIDEATVKNIQSTFKSNKEIATHLKAIKTEVGKTDAGKTYTAAKNTAKEANKSVANAEKALKDAVDPTPEQTKALNKALEDAQAHAKDAQAALKDSKSAYDEILATTKESLEITTKDGKVIKGTALNGKQLEDFKAIKELQETAASETDKQTLANWIEALAKSIK